MLQRLCQVYAAAGAAAGSTLRGHRLAAGQRHRYPAGSGNRVQRHQQHLSGAAHRLRQHQLSADRRHGKDLRDRPCEQRCQPEGRCFTGGAPRFQHQHRLPVSERRSAGNGRHLLRHGQQVRPPPRGDVKHPAGCKGGRLPHRPAGHHHHRQRWPELHRGYRALCAGQPAEPHRPVGFQHRAAGLHRQREQQKVSSAHLRQPACGKESSPLFQL